MITITKIAISDSDNTVLVTYSDGSIIDFPLDSFTGQLHYARLQSDETWMVEHACKVNDPERAKDAHYYANVVTDWVPVFDLSLVSDDNPSGKPAVN